jgi:hypothetical protein
MKRIFLFLVFALATGLVANAQEPLLVTRQIPPLPDPVITADQVSGVYRDGTSELRLQTLSPNRLKIEFKNDWKVVYYSNSSNLPNAEAAIVEANIKGNGARYVTGDSKKCKVTLTFLTNRIEVAKEGSAADCGFRQNVVVTRGTYRRIKGGHARLVRLR